MNIAGNISTLYEGGKKHAVSGIAGGLVGAIITVGGMFAQEWSNQSLRKEANEKSVRRDEKMEKARLEAREDAKDAATASKDLDRRVTRLEAAVTFFRGSDWVKASEHAVSANRAAGITPDPKIYEQRAVAE